MLLHIPDVLTEAEVAECRATLLTAAWTDGRDTAGHLSAAVKRNLQLAWDDPTARRVSALVADRLGRNPLFLAAALPREVLPPLFNRYEGGGQYGPHLDGAIHHVDGENRRIRTDLSLTLWLSAPDEYDGGELVVADLVGDRAFKLPAGDALLYAATSIHHVAPVTRGTRLAAFTWVQSLVRDGGERALLLDLDAAIQQLPQDERAHADRLRLSNVYHNLLRRWAEP